ncbi:hypothetical protein [Pontibacter akesuensis]|uniref:Uncharacterized protein n=1 Tax=Pontibacter akesuensis TaxID=388950 RepID=A0A1I7G3H9_9BACT|nr:hypothetical protein [Pontibacter akesuensis]GHA59029.1 hypothetical protein GCM10007389_08750 [Pontibacter akesuensis]SFU43008.1 hypothetical protein SAMN04487941_0687 [Pontibacter akesuensis]
MKISLNYKFLIGLAVKLVLASAVVCFLLVQLIWGDAVEVPLWGQRSISTDLVSYSIVSGFFTSYLVTRSTRKALDENKVLPLHWHLKSQTLIDRLPSLSLFRAFILSLTGVSTSFILILLLELSGSYFVPLAEYKLLFVTYGMLLSIAITIMAFYRALGDKVLKKSEL